MIAPSLLNLERETRFELTPLALARRTLCRLLALSVFGRQALRRALGLVFA